MKRGSFFMIDNVIKLLFRSMLQPHDAFCIYLFMIDFAGQFVQTVYLPAQPPQPLSYVPGIRYNNTSPIATPAHRDQLYAEWRPFWDVTRPILLEKSPRHMLMTLLLQYWFGPEHTAFIGILRHPLAQTRMQWWRSGRQPGCVENGIRHWLELQETMVQDMRQLRHRVVVHFERLAQGNTER